MAWICRDYMDAQNFKRPENMIYHGPGSLCRSCGHTDYGADLVVTVGAWLSVLIDPEHSAACLAEIERLRGEG